MMSKKLQQISVPLISVFLGSCLEPLSCGSSAMMLSGVKEELFYTALVASVGLENFPCHGSLVTDRSRFRSCQSSRLL